MIETRLYEAVLSEARCAAGAYTCYGHKLAPFSLRHSLQLEALECPLFTGEAWTAWDLQLAAEICSRRELTPSPRRPGWWSHLRHDPEIEEARFYEYFSACYARPELYDRPDSAGGSTLHAPLELIIVTYLTRKSSITEERAWTMPAGLAFWHFESIKEQEGGDSSILSEAMAAEIAAANSDEARAETERKTRYFIGLGTAIDQAQSPTERETATGERELYIRTGEVPADFV